MDGTLIDSGHDITVSVNHVRRVNHGLPPVPAATVVEWINRPVRNLPKLFYGTESYEARDRELFERHYHEQCIRHPVLYPGIVETLEALALRGVAMAVATNAPSAFARRMIGHLGIDGYFDEIVGADTVGVSKPDPAMLHAVFDRTGFRPSLHRGWMVGDNAKDIEAAHAAGIRGVFCTWGFSPAGEAEYVIDTPHSLLDFV